MAEWVLVPKEPTPEMLEAAWDATHARTRAEFMAMELAGSARVQHILKMKSRWAAMLAAAPKQ